MIEIFDEREMLAEAAPAEEGALALIQELGLKTMPDGERIAYPLPNKQQWFVIQMLFPERTKIKDYDAGGIPLRVLKEIRSYKAEYPKHILVVCHQAQAIVKDPILLAYTGNYEWGATQTSTASNEYRLIARWGDALDDWGQLAKRATTIMRENIRNECEKNTTRLKRLMNELNNVNIEDNTIPEITIRNLPEGY
jgi:hypothetical protein